MTEIEKIKFCVEARLLDHIGLAMYSSLPKAISELVANSYDADAEDVFITIPEEIGDDSEITIQDNGNGMERDEIINIYMHLGINTRKIRKATPKFQRLPIGSKGIGKLAGLGIANTMHIATIKEGIKHEFTIDREKLNLPSLNLSDIEFDLIRTETREENSTKVTLKNLLQHVSSISTSELLVFLAQEFDFTTNFNVYVNGQKLRLKDIPGETLDIRDKIKPYGEVRGNIKIANRKRDIRVPGIMTYVRGKMILGPTLFDINTHGHQYRVADRILGEIEANFFDPEEPSDLLDEFIISTSRDRFNQNNPKFLAYKHWVEKRLIEISKRLEKEQEKARREKILKSRNVQSLLKGLPRELKKRVLDLIESIVPKLNNLSDSDADTVLGIVVRAAESSAVIEILKKIKEASTIDIKRLASLLQGWGIYEIAAITELIKRRLDILDEFEAVINNMDALEYKDVHKLLEKNPWLLNDNYKLYGSNKSLKVALDLELKKRFRGHKRDRPDLICKSLLEKVVIIELKRPNHLIDSGDYSQLKIYKNIIRSHSPNSKLIECFLIGNQFDPAVRDPEDERIGVYLKSYAEIIQEAKERYREILAVLQEEQEEGE